MIDNLKKTLAGKEGETLAAKDARNVALLATGAGLLLGYLVFKESK